MGTSTETSLLERSLVTLGIYGLASGGCKSTEWRAYYNAKDRCTRPNNISYPYYGGRGIQFLYESIEQFIADVGFRPSPQHSLDRINNDGHYELGNCKWSTGTEQISNRRIKQLPEFSTDALIAECQRRGLPIQSLPAENTPATL